MMMGDGVITPAISVISAVEGLGIASSAFAPYVVPISLVVIVLLFGVQRSGTERVGKLFGPVMVVWFIVIGVLGARAILVHPEVAHALDPRYGLHFLFHDGLAGFTILGGVVLAVTGVEAMYADLSHFGRGPIVTGWYTLVFPALMLNYFGQGANLLADPRAIVEPVLLARAGVGADPDGRARDRRDRDRVAGADLGDLHADRAGDRAQPRAARAGACTPRTATRARCTCRR